MSKQGPALGSIFEKDLSGWQLRYGYLLLIEHGLMGVFPALTAEDNEPVVVVEKPLLKMVWDCLEHKRAKVATQLLLYNPTKGIGYSLQATIDSPEPKEMSPLKVLSSKKIHELTGTSGPGEASKFKWTPGFVSFDASDWPMPAELNWP
ncbi:MAG: hypothetical protein WC526_01065 [Patescibacteria group bacterium]